ncbi:MAG: hypothetical protein LBQ24_06630 [Candidatus Peribacteria bacterium]|jgi:hypothetical protein|nr:hypothetical protein [Candidatus Peribacteria bacterium]
MVKLSSHSHIVKLLFAIFGAETLKYQIQEVAVQKILKFAFHSFTFSFIDGEEITLEYFGKISKLTSVLESLKTKLLYLSFNSTCKVVYELESASILFSDKIKSIFIGTSGRIVIDFEIIQSQSKFSSIFTFLEAKVLVVNSILPTQATKSK